MIFLVFFDDFNVYIKKNILIFLLIKNILNHNLKLTLNLIRGRESKRKICQNSILYIYHMLL